MVSTRTVIAVACLALGLSPLGLVAQAPISGTPPSSTATVAKSSQDGSNPVCEVSSASTSLPAPTDIIPLDAMEQMLKEAWLQNLANAGDKYFENLNNDCSQTTIPPPLSQSSELPGSMSRTSRAFSPSASQASSSSYLWILSATAPDSAPATDDAVYLVNLNTGATVATILTPGPIPLKIAAGNTGQYVYAAIEQVPAGETGIPAHPPLVEVIDTSTFSITQTIDLPQGVTPGKLASSPDDRYLYVPCSPQGEVLVIDTENPSSVATIPLTITTRSGQSAAGALGNAAITPDGELLFVLCGAGFCVVDTTTQQQIAYVGYAAGLEALSDLVIDPTGSVIFFSGQTYVYAYSTATLTQIGSVLTKQGVQLNNIGITLDGSAVFASDQNSPAVFFIDPVALSSTELDFPAPSPFPCDLPPMFTMVVQ